MITGYNLAQYTSDITSFGVGIALTIPVFAINSSSCDRNARRRPQSRSYPVPRAGLPSLPTGSLGPILPYRRLQGAELACPQGVVLADLLVSVFNQMPSHKLQCALQRAIRIHLRRLYLDQRVQR